jgi:hypothetical protein
MPRGVYRRKNGKRKPIKRSVDLVNHPPHYTQGKIETILVIEDVIQFWPAHEAYSVGNVIRYISRAVHKGDKQKDLEKAQFYLDRLVGHPGKGQ